MHQATQLLGMFLFVGGIILAFAYAENRLLGSSIAGSGIPILIASKIIGVLEEIRDRLPEPEKEDKKNR